LIHEGFKKEIDPSIIGGIKNICDCSRIANIVKKEMSEKEFIKSKVYDRLIEYESQISNSPRRKIS